MRQHPFVLEAFGIIEQTRDRIAHATTAGVHRVDGFEKSINRNA